MNTNETGNNEMDNMFAPTTPEEAAAQSTPSRGMEVVADILKPNTPRLKWEEGDNWMRFLNPYRNPWYLAVPTYEMTAGNKTAKVISPEYFGDVNLFLAVQIACYKNAATRPFMWTKENEKGFHFREYRRALMVAARYEHTLSNFAVIQVTLGKIPYKKKDAPERPYKESWGDALIKIPTEPLVDPTRPMEDSGTLPLRWGAIFDPVDGRLIKCSLSNVGTMQITASFTPADSLMPLGEWMLDGKPIKQRPAPPNAQFVPKPQYAETLRNAPNLVKSLRRLTVDEQRELIMMFIPEALQDFARDVIEQELKSPNRKAPAPSAPVTTKTIPVPVEDVSETSEADQLYNEFVKNLGPKFKEVGETVVRKIIERSLVNPTNVKQIAEFSPDVLKALVAS